MGGGIRMGNTCKPMAVSFQCMTKFTTKKKKKPKPNYMLFITGILKTPRNRKGKTKRTVKDIPHIN